MDEQLKALLQDTIDSSLYQIVLSNPRRKDEIFKIKIKPVMIKGKLLFQETAYEDTKVFHKNYDCYEIQDHIIAVLTENFRQCEISHRNCRATVLVSKKGKVNINLKKLQKQEESTEREQALQLMHNRVKRYILEEGTVVPFLVDLGVQTKEGKIIRARYDKYKQINRFLEFIEDILPTLSKEETVRVIDFGCGKSYLTFAMYYYLHDLKGYDVEITGLDLKEDVIDHCNLLSHKYGYEKLHFLQGDIAEYDEIRTVDMVVTLHACDTATDYALAKAVLWNAKAILSVPCCQHEVNKQIHNEELDSVLQYGIIKERMSALITDAIRANLLEASGYRTDILEFIDMEHTPKNLLIRAVKRGHADEKRKKAYKQKVKETTEFLGIDPTLLRLLSLPGQMTEE